MNFVFCSRQVYPKQATTLNLMWHEISRKEHFCELQTETGIFVFPLFCFFFALAFYVFTFWPKNNKTDPPLTFVETIKYKFPLQLNNIIVRNTLVRLSAVTVVFLFSLEILSLGVTWQLVKQISDRGVINDQWNNVWCNWRSWPNKDKKLRRNNLISIFVLAF